MLMTIVELKMKIYISYSLTLTKIASSDRNSMSVSLYLVNNNNNIVTTYIIIKHNIIIFLWQQNSNMYLTFYWIHYNFLSETRWVKFRHHLLQFNELNVIYRMWTLFYSMKCVYRWWGSNRYMMSSLNYMNCIINCYYLLII